MPFLGRMRRCWFEIDDISMNTLRRLPAKTLHKLQYVSKEWQKLISDRSFIALQLKTTEPVSGFFFQEIFQCIDDDVESMSYISLENDKEKVWSTVLNFLPEKVVLLSSNNGLLCCRSCLPNPQPLLYVCNPLNKQQRTVKWPSISRDSSIAMFFDPLMNPINDSTHFKLVAVSRIETKEEEYCFFFDIYSSRTGLWQRSKECCQCDYNLVKNKGILVDGVLYWVTDGYTILMFDAENEFSWLISAPLPATEFSSVSEMCIGESRGKLSCVIVSEDGLQLWILEDRFSSQWELKIAIPLDDLERDNPMELHELSERVGSRIGGESIAWMDPLAFKDGMLLMRVSARFYSYEFDSKTMKKLCHATNLGPHSMFFPIVVPYSMSLVPLG